jgi:hypothetical protein
MPPPIPDNGGEDTQNFLWAAFSPRFVGIYYQFAVTDLLAGSTDGAKSRDEFLPVVETDVSGKERFPLSFTRGSFSCRDSGVVQSIRWPGPIGSSLHMPALSGPRWTMLSTIRFNTEQSTGRPSRKKILTMALMGILSPRPLSGCNARVLTLRSQPCPHTPATRGPEIGPPHLYPHRFGETSRDPGA